MANFLTLDDFNFSEKTVLVRVDFNSPVDPETQEVLDDTRIRAHAETTINELVQKNAKIVILAHQGRPGEPDFLPLTQHATILGKLLGKPVKYVNDVFGEAAQKAILQLKSSEILVLDNVRTIADERKKRSPEEHAKSEFVQRLAPLADFFVNDAFAAAHRSHISIVGFPVVLPAVAGRIMERELTALTKVLEATEKPCLFIIGGAKGDDSLEISRYVLKNTIADYVLTGGVIGHIFLTAKGIDLGKPNTQYLEKKNLLSLVPGIKALMREYPQAILTPVDVAIEEDEKRKEIPISKLPTNHPIFDIGSATAKKYGDLIRTAKSIVISGPLGVYENPQFLMGTKSVFEAAATSQAFSLVGGGHTVAAIEKMGWPKKFHISVLQAAL